jgi:hypothetical protein
MSPASVWRTTDPKPPRSPRRFCTGQRRDIPAHGYGGARQSRRDCASTEHRWTGNRPRSRPRGIRRRHRPPPTPPMAPHDFQHGRRADGHGRRAGSQHARGRVLPCGNVGADGSRPVVALEQRVPSPHGVGHAVLRLVARGVGPVQRSRTKSCSTRCSTCTTSAREKTRLRTTLRSLHSVSR